MSRIRRSLNRARSPRSAITSVFAVGLLLLSAAAGLIAWREKHEQALRQSAANDHLYQRWLDKNVVYIITPAERDAFLALTSDREREHFIKQFWLRRDPTPDTVRNEFKEEHYRRIDYANRNFGSSIPGWKTDRGRVYITYGPPDETRWYSPKMSTRARDAWCYRHIEDAGGEAVFEFSRDPGDREGSLMRAARTGQTAYTQSGVISLALTNLHPGIFTKPGRIKLNGRDAEKRLITKAKQLCLTPQSQRRLRTSLRFDVLINKEGRISETSLVSGSPLLLEPAETALRERVYRPTLVKGKPVEAITQVDLNFILSQ